jgi:hypothetical protein
VYAVLHGLATHAPCHRLILWAKEPQGIQGKRWVPTVDGMRDTIRWTNLPLLLK